jgi:hypothetical protein
MGRTSIAECSNPEAVSVTLGAWMFHVKHRSGSGPVPFHVKRFVNRLNEGLLLSNTEFAEDDIEDVFDVDPAKQSAEGIGRSPELLGGEFFALAHYGDRPAQ